LLIALCLVAFIVIMVHVGFRAPRIRESGTPAQFELNYQEIDIPGIKGTHLFGWFLPVENAAQTIILLHGWGGNAEMMLPLARPFIDTGINVLLFDSHNHGRSDRGAISSMPRFAEDMDSAIDWLKNQHPEKSRRIALLGHSVGAGAVLLVASRRDDIAAVISVSAFAHPDRMMRRYLAGKKIPRTVISAILRYVEWVIGARFDHIAPLNTVCKIRCPVLLVHGKADNTVPVEDARDILENCSQPHIKLVEIEGADHDSVDMIELHAHQLSTFLQQNGFSK
jgi:alpha-beta hydrolase superfamily lysophospholipase